jgi:hypothetical protein
LKKFLFLVKTAILTGVQCCQTQFWKGPTQGSSLQGLGSFDLVVSEEKN